MSRGFTLIELLVVITIVALLASILLPAIGLVRKSALAAACRTQQRQLGIAVTAYAGEHDGLMPHAQAFIDGRYSNAMYEEWLGQYLAADGSSPAFAFRCPGERVLPTSLGLSARVCADVWAAWEDTTLSSLSRQSDRPLAGDSNGDIRWVPDYGTCPDEILPVAWNTRTDPRASKARHRAGINVCFLDGHVRLTQDILGEIAAGTIAY